jgi:addiction module RelB/DinJ family antitoxin
LNTTITINTENELKTKVQSVFDDLGMDISTAVNMFFWHVVNERSMPFANDKTTNNTKKSPRSAMRGILKDKVWMADGFDEPIEEMKDYM